MEDKKDNFRESYPSPNLIYRNNLIKRILDDFDLELKQILEIGCGTGIFLEYLGGVNASLTGLELDEKAFALASKRCKASNITIIQRDFFEIYDSFDIILCFDVLEHIKDDNAALQKIGTLLKSGGYLIITVPGNKALYGQKDIAHGHYRRYGKVELLDKLHQNRFEVVLFYSWGVTLLARLNRLFTRKAGENVNLEKQTLESSYSAPPSVLTKLLHPIYQRMPFLLRFQDPFLKTNFMNTHFLCVCRKK